VPAVVVSPYSKPHGVTNVVHDHTSVLAFIEQKWNLPALTHRDANAHSLLDFLDLSKPRLLHPPTLAKPADPTAADLRCSTKLPQRPVIPNHHRHHHHHHQHTGRHDAGHAGATSPSQHSSGETLPNTGGDPLALPATAAITVAAAAARAVRWNRAEGSASQAANCSSCGSEGGSRSA
jgi:hypothetical protein